MESVESHPQSVSEQQTPAPETAEPCPTPLSTAEVFESFERDAEAWEIAGPAGPIRGHTLGQGPPLYFLNGLEGTSDLFCLLAWLLREDFRCVLYDSQLNADTVASLGKEVSQLPDVQQLLAVVDSLGDEDILLYGSGFGGWLALAGMLTANGRFRGAILQAAYAQKKLKLAEKLLLALAKRSKRTLKEVPGWRTVFVQNHRPWFPPFDELRFALFHQIAGNVSVQDLAKHLRQLRRVRLDQRLAEITQPVLLLNSEGEGKVLQQRQTELEHALPHVRKEWLQHSGLIPHWTHPHRVAKLIRQFAFPKEDQSSHPETSS
ncbi:MAG: alpha/beta hydrolase [Planctomycetaceae bacterium]|nr:alpha/beta hydrolase [Planctomycetaceae bacterium]